MAPGRRPGFLCNVERRQQRRGGRIWADRFHLGLHRERRCLVPAFQSGYFSKRVGIIFKTALPFRTLEAHSCASKHWAAPPCLEDHAPRVTEDRPRQSQDPPCSRSWGQGCQGKHRTSSLAHSYFSSRSRKAGWWCLSAVLHSGLRFSFVSRITPPPHTTLSPG